MIIESSLNLRMCMKPKKDKKKKMAASVKEYLIICEDKSDVAPTVNWEGRLNTIKRMMSKTEKDIQELNSNV